MQLSFRRLIVLAVLLAVLLTAGLMFYRQTPVFVTAEVERLGGEVFWHGYGTISVRPFARFFRLQTGNQADICLSRTNVDDAWLGKHRSGIAGFPKLGLYLNATRITDNGLRHLCGLDNLQDLDLGDTDLTDAGLEHLTSLPNLKTVRIERTAVTDVGLRRLRGLDNLQNLDLGESDVTDDGLRHLHGLENLQQLALGKTDITDAGLEHLTSLPNLNTLWLERTAVTDEGLQILSRLPKLFYVGLDGRQATDRGLAHLAKCPRTITHLRLCDVDDETITRLGSWPQLIILEVEGQGVTNASVPIFMRMQKLRSLWLTNTSLSDAGLAMLRGALPECSVHPQVVKARPARRSAR